MTDGLVDAAGTRLGARVGSGGVGAWLVPDLHGSIAAGLAPAATAVSDALRYDGYGVTLAVHAGSRQRSHRPLALPGQARPRAGTRRRHPGLLRRPRAKPRGTRMVGVAPPARPAPPAEVGEHGAAGRAVARRREHRAKGHRRGRGQRLEVVGGHAAHHWR